MNGNKNNNQRQQMGPGRGPGRGPRNLFVEKPKDFKGTLKKLLVYINYKKVLFISLMVIMLFSTILNLLSPILQKNVLDALDFQSKNYGWDRALKFIIILAIVYLVSTILSYFQQRTSARLSQETVRKIRNDLFSKFVRLPIKFLDTHSHGDLMSRMTNDVDKISNTISSSISSILVSNTSPVLSINKALLGLLRFITLTLFPALMKAYPFIIISAESAIASSLFINNPHFLNWLQKFLYIKI